MEAQFENDDAYQCEIVFTTDCTESNVVNGVEDDSVYPDDIPIWIEEHYIVTASKTAKTAKSNTPKQYPTPRFGRNNENLYGSNLLSCDCG
jgi:hypothetical protein